MRSSRNNAPGFAEKSWSRRLEQTLKRERRRVKSGLAAVGIKVGPQWDDPHWRRGEILRRFEVKLVLDVGANVGQYGLRLRRQGRYDGRIISFEPVSKAYEALARTALKDPRWDCMKLALSDKDGTAEITVAAGSNCSSFLPFKTRDRRPVADAIPVAIERVRTARLDTLGLVTRADAAMVKLDVQGFEPRVIAGAPETLKLTSLIECELAFEHLYERQPTFREVVDVIDELGFQPISMARGNIDHTTASLTYVDMIFARR